MRTLAWETATGWKTVGDRVSRQLWRLESDALCAEARHRTGLECFGEPAIDPALTTLLNSLENEADLHLLGRVLIRFHLRDLLTTRLQLVNLWSEHAAAIAASRIQRPIFITGMPRSGSTFLHELLTQDPANRAPRVWEIMFPVPLKSKLPSTMDPRVRKTEFYLRCFRFLAPGADSVYPMRARTPHECVAIHSYTLLSDEFLSTNPLDQRFGHNSAPQWSNWYRGRKLGLRPQYGKITKATKTEVMTVQDLEGEDYTHALPDLVYNSDEHVLKNV